MSQYFLPPIKAVPKDGLSSPKSIRSVELFPAPFGPKKAVTSPSSAVKDTFFNISPSL